jgi:hypothetical protein
MRFSIRDVLWLTVLVALGVGWWVDHGVLVRTAADTKKLADEIEIERAEWELRTQMEAVEHNKTLRVIEQSGLVITSNGKKDVLMKIREADPGFDIAQPVTVSDP